MLIEFSVENFLSISNRLTLSMEREDNRSSNNHAYLTLFKDIKVVPIMSIYGANGSGKTNLLDAIEWAVRAIVYKPRTFNVPYAFSLNNDGVSHFEFKFMLRSIVYRYGFAVKREISQVIIVNEKLEEANYGDGYNTIYEINNGKLVNTSVSSLRDNDDDTIQINQLSIFSIARMSVKVKEAYDFFRTFNFLDKYYDLNDIVRLLAPVLENEEDKTKIIDFLEAADINIRDFKIEKTSDNQISINTIHVIDDIEYSLSLRHESSGTIKFLTILATNFLSSITPQILIIDELEDNLHPLLCKNLLKAYLNNINKSSRSQLIFTTHFVDLLDRGLLKLDEMAIITKAYASESSRLDKISSFSEAVNSRKKIKLLYETGKFGGKPNLQSFTKIIHNHKSLNY